MKTKLFSTAILLAAVSAGTYVYAFDNSEQQPNLVHNNFSDTIQVHTHTIKKNTVRLFPNPTSTGDLTITSDSNEALSFYIFDLEGTLIHQINLNGKVKKTIRNLQKGVYLYDVFKNDESIEQGKIIVK